MKINIGTVDIIITMATIKFAQPGYSNGDNQAFEPAYLLLNGS